MNNLLKQQKALNENILNRTINKLCSTKLNMGRKNDQKNHSNINFYNNLNCM